MLICTPPFQIPIHWLIVSDGGFIAQSDIRGKERDPRKPGIDTMPMTSVPRCLRHSPLTKRAFLASNIVVELYPFLPILKNGNYQVNESQVGGRRGFLKGSAHSIQGGCKFLKRVTEL